MPGQHSRQRATVDYYVSDFAKRTATDRASSPGWLGEIRKHAIDHFAAAGFPSTRDERWRFTNFSQLGERTFAIGNGRSGQAAPRAEVNAEIGWLSDVRVVFVDGMFSPELSSLDELPDGAVFGSLAKMMNDRPNALERDLARIANSVDSPFTALNTAFFSEGGVVLVPDGVSVERPIQFLFLTSDHKTDSVSHPHNLVIVGENAEATIVESYVGLGGGFTWTNSVTEIVLGDAARLKAHRVQQEGANSFHTATTQCRQGRDSNLTFSTVDFGSSLSRHDINFQLNGIGASCSLQGLSHLQNRQHADNHTTIEHSTHHCTSVEQFNGIFDDSSHGVFTGRVVVKPDAQQTDAIQSSRNLLLSDTARADTQPQLEIFADDVKCTHGATVGPIDDEAIFYLRSKGIPAADARTLLTYGFAAEIMRPIEVTGLRNYLEAVLMSRLGGEERNTRG